MRLEFVRLTATRIPKKFLENWLKIITRELIKKGHRFDSKKSLVLVFVDKKKMKALNKRYRGKDRPTDVLSFESEDPQSFGELVFCMPVLKTQAREHGLSLKHELAYMFLHGILHLLGYEHEKSEKQAEAMYALQFAIFDKIDKVRS